MNIVNYLSRPTWLQRSRGYSLAFSESACRQLRLGRINVRLRDDGVNKALSIRLELLKTRQSCGIVKPFGVV